MRNTFLFLLFFRIVYSNKVFNDKMLVFYFVKLPLTRQINGISIEQKFHQLKSYIRMHGVYELGETI